MPKITTNYSFLHVIAVFLEQRKRSRHIEQVTNARTNHLTSFFHNGEFSNNNFNKYRTQSGNVTIILTIRYLSFDKYFPFVHSEKSHHELAVPDIVEFLHSEEYNVTELYTCYIDQISQGIKCCFADKDEDPILAHSLSKYKKLLAKHKKRVLRMEKKQSPFLQANESIKMRLIQSCQNKQQEILSILKFEARDKSMFWFHCNTCNQKYLTYLIDEEGSKRTYLSLKKYCTTCQKQTYSQTHNNTNETILDPIWINSEGKHCYNIPEELQHLTLAEKLLIQKNAVLMPVVHMYKGRIGIRGHTVMFEKDMQDLCQELPRKKVDVVWILKEYENVTTGQIQCDYFKVRKKKVLEALIWLKKHHIGYQNIQIEPANLEWMDNKTEADLGKDQVNFMEQRSVDIDNTTQVGETVASTQTQIDCDVQMATQGTGFDRNLRADFTTTKSDSATINTLQKAATKTGKDKISALQFPHVDDNPINEYQTTRLFADTYPWLFPGGIGNLTSNDDLKKQKSKAVSWSQKLMRWEDGRFMRDPLFGFHLQNFLQRHQNNSSGLYFATNYISDPSITVEEIVDQIDEGDFSFIHKLMNFSSDRIKGSDGWWRSKKHELNSWISYHVSKGHGPPTLFLTLSCAEYWWEELIEIIYKRCENTEDWEEAKKMKYSENKKEKNNAKYNLVEKYTAVVQEYFQMRVDNWMKTIGKNIFGIKYHWLRFEFAGGRGQIHAHILAITEDIQVIQDFHNAWSKNDKDKATTTMSTYARQRLSLTAELTLPSSTESTTQTYEPAVGKKYHTIEDNDIDIAQLCNEVHMHCCNKFCLRLPRNR